LFLGKATFAEFAQYVVDMWSAGRLLDIHWRPQYKLCRPCYIKYDYIGRFENLHEDATNVLTVLTKFGEPSTNVRFPRVNRNYQNVTLSQVVKSYYAKIPYNLLKKLISLYKLDYELFGYDYQWVL